MSPKDNDHYLSNVCWIVEVCFRRETMISILVMSAFESQCLSSWKSRRLQFNVCLHEQINVQASYKCFCKDQCQAWESKPKADNRTIPTSRSLSIRSHSP